MATQGVLQVSDNRRWKIGDGELIDGSVSLAEGKEASSLEVTIADERGQLANDLPLILIEDVPAQPAQIDVTFVAELGAGDVTSAITGVSVPKETIVETSALDEVLAGEAPERVQFKTDKALGPGDFSRPEGSGPNSLGQARATVTCTAVEPGAGGNISGSPKVGQGEEISLAVPLAGIDRVFHTAPATGGRDSGVTGERVPVDCWLGRSSTKSPPKVFSGFLSQLTYSGAPDRVKLLAVDKSSSMRREQRSRAFNGTGIEELVRRVAAENDFKTDLSKADLSGVPLTRHLQHGTTDWQFLDRILSSVGHRLKMRGNTVYVTKVGEIREDPETLVLERQDVSDFSFEVDELTKHTTPNVSALSGAKASDHGDGTQAQSRAVQLRRTGVPETYDGTPSEIRQQAEREKQAEAREHRLFRCSLQGNDLYPRLDTDDQVILNGWGRRFDGTWWIDSISHSFEGTTSFSLTSDNSGE